MQGAISEEVRAGNMRGHGYRKDCYYGQRARGEFMYMSGTYEDLFSPGLLVSKMEQTKLYKWEQRSGRKERRDIMCTYSHIVQGKRVREKRKGEQDEEGSRKWRKDDSKSMLSESCVRAIEG